MKNHRASFVRAAVTLAACLLLPSCMNYSENDRRLVRRSDGTNILAGKPDGSDKFVHVDVGLKRLNSHGGDPVRAAEIESKQVVEEFGLCPHGYSLRMIPQGRNGDYGFGWTIVCHEA